MAASKKKHNEVVRWLLKSGAAADISKEFGSPAEQTAYLEARTYCANVACSGAGLKKCANCSEAYFYSKECQVEAWAAHKADCKLRANVKAGKKK
jgi:hypothetical protein